MFGTAEKALVYEIKTTLEDENAFETCEKVISENNLGTRKKLLFLGDSGTGKTETFRSFLGKTEHQSNDEDVSIIYTRGSDISLDCHVEEYVPIWRISQYDENGNISNIRLTVKKAPSLSLPANQRRKDTANEDIHDFLHLFLFILAGGFQSNLDIFSLIVLLFVVHQQYRYDRLLDTIYPMGLIFSLQGIDVLGLVDGTNMTLLKFLCHVACLIIAVALLMFLFGMEQHHGGSLGYTVGLCVIVFPKNDSQSEDHVQIKLINTLICCLLASITTKISKQISVSSTLIQLIAATVALIWNQCTSVFNLGLPITILMDLVSRMSYEFGKTISFKYSNGDRERKTPNFAVITVYYITYGYLFILNTNQSTLSHCTAKETVIFHFLGVLFAIHVYYFYGEDRTKMYEKLNYPTMPVSEFLGQKLSLWKLENDFPSDMLPNDAVCLLFFNAAYAVKNQMDEKKSLENWLNKISSQSWRRNIPVFYIGTHSESVSRKELEEFAISISSNLDYRFSNMVMTNKDGLPVFYVDNKEDHNQGLEILKRRILMETR